MRNALIGIVLFVTALLLGAVLERFISTAEAAMKPNFARIIDVSEVTTDPIESDIIDCPHNATEVKFACVSDQSGTVTLKYQGIGGESVDVADGTDLALTADTLFILNDDRGLKRYVLSFNPAATPHTTWCDVFCGGGGR